MAKSVKNSATTYSVPPVAEPIAARVVTPVTAPTPVVTSVAPVVSRVLSLRPGSIVTSAGTLEYKEVMELPVAEAQLLAKMFPGMIQSLS